MRQFSELFTEASKPRRQRAPTAARKPSANQQRPATKKPKSYLKHFIKDRLHANFGVAGQILGHWLMKEDEDGKQARVDQFLRATFGDHKKKPCPQCHGSGKVKTGNHKLMNIQKSDLRTCKKCNGRGRLTEEVIAEGDTTLHRALGAMGYKRPLDKEGNVEDPCLYSHRRQLKGDHFVELGKSLEKLGFVHNPEYDEDSNGLVHKWERSGQRVTATPEYMKGHNIEIEGA